MVTRLGPDLRFGLRGIARRPAFAAVVVLTLAFGVGVNTAIFSLFQQVLLRPLPVPAPERLVNLTAPGPAGDVRRSCGREGSCQSIFSYPMFRDLARAQTPFVGVAAHRLDDMTVGLPGAATSSTGMLVSGDYFRVLGVEPALGRLLGPADDQDGAAQSVVLSHSYWRNDLGGDPAVLGRTLLVDGQPLTIVGVAPEDFRRVTPGLHPAVFVPIAFRVHTHDYAAAPGLDDRLSLWVYLFARLAPGVSVEQAEAALNPLYSGIVNDVEAPLQTGLDAAALAAFRAKRLVLEPGAHGQSRVPDGARPTLTALLAVAAVVLVLCCANVANVMLARGSDRIGEMAVRTSLGASGPRLVALLLTEALLLALAAAALGWPLALAALSGFAAWLPGLRGAAFDIRLDYAAAAFALGAAALCALAFSLAPMRKVWRIEPSRVLQAYGARQTGGKAAARFRAGLATTQIALSMALLVLAALFARSLVNIGRVDLGIEIDSLATLSIAPEIAGYSPERAAPLYERLEQALAAVPGVTAVASSTVPLLGQQGWGGGVTVEGADPEPQSEVRRGGVLFNNVGAGFFANVGMSLIAGRGFTEADGRAAPKVAVVNERLAELYGLGPEALGKRLKIGASPEAPFDTEIVGIVRDAKYQDAKQAIEPQVFFPWRQLGVPLGRMTYYARSLLPADQLLGTLAKVVADVDPALPVLDLRTMRQQVREGVAEDRSIAALASGFAVLATLLAAVGLYGVLSYTIAQRTRELGLRLALGARPAALRAMVLRQVAAMAAVGCAVGVGAALLLGHTMRALLFNVGPVDPGALAAAAVVLVAVVLTAGYLPARRASRIDPTVALRCE
jgi:predicted permease